MHTHIEPDFILSQHFEHLHMKKKHLRTHIGPYSIYSLELTGHINTIHIPTYLVRSVFHLKPTVMNKTGQFHANAHTLDELNSNSQALGMFGCVTFNVRINEPRYSNEWFTLRTDTDILFL